MVDAPGTIVYGKLGAGGISTLLARLLMIGGEGRKSSPARRIFRHRIMIVPLRSPPPTPLAPPAEPVVVLTTCPDEAVAAKIARELVESGLSACVSREGPVHSTYRWQEAVQDEPEVLLIIKR